MGTNHTSPSDRHKLVGRALVVVLLLAAVGVGWRWIEGAAAEPATIEREKAGKTQAEKEQPKGAAAVQTVRTLSQAGHKAEIGYVQVSPDSRWALILYLNHELRLWDLEAGAFVIGYYFGPHISSAGFSGDGRRMVVADPHWVSVRDLASDGGWYRFEPCASDPSDAVTWAFLSHDGKNVLVGCLRGQIGMWVADTGKLTRSFVDNEGNARPAAVVGLTLLPDTFTLLSVDEHRTLKLWDIATGQVLCRTSDHQLVTFSAAGGFVLLWQARDRMLRTWDPKTCTLRDKTTAPPGIDDFWITTPDGKRVLSRENQSTLTVWDAANGNTLYRIQGRGPVFAFITFSPDSRFMLTHDDGDGGLQLRDATDGRVIRRFDVRFKHYLQLFGRVTFTSDGHRIWAVAPDGMLKGWDVETGATVRSFPWRLPSGETK